MKSVTNSNRFPVHVYRNGQDEALRLSSSTASGDRTDVSAWRMPDGHRTRITSAPPLEPRPNTTSAGATAGVADDVSSRWRRLPARMSILAPTPPRLLARPVRRTRTDARAL